MNLNFRVLIEARCIIRLIQLALAVFAFATTARFETVATIGIKCKEYEKDVQYKLGYPFKKLELRSPDGCTNISEILFKTYSFPFDFSIHAEFFVATGVLSLLYTVGAILIYVFWQRLYSTNPLAPIVDLIGTGVLSFLWFVASCVWVQGVVDMKYYTYPYNVMQNLVICIQYPRACHSLSDGDLTCLYVSLGSGFANCVLWLSSICFVQGGRPYTLYYRQKVEPPAMEKQQPLEEKDLKMMEEQSPPQIMEKQHPPTVVLEKDPKMIEGGYKY